MTIGNVNPLILAAGVLLAILVTVVGTLNAAPLSPQAIAQVSKAEDFREKGDVRAAVVALKNAIQRHPDNAGLRYKIGLLYLDAGDGAAAERALDRARELGMDEFETSLALGRAWLLLRKTSDVLRELHPEIAPTPSQKAAVSLLRGNAQLQLGETEAAKSGFRSALTEVPQYAPAFARLAFVSIMEGDLDSAQVLLTGAEQGSQADPAELKWLQGHLAYERGEYSEAETAFEALLKIRPWQIQRRRDLAVAQLQQQKYEQANRNLTLVLEALPKDPDTLFFQSLLAFLQEDYTRAAELSSKVAYSAISPRALFVAGASSYQLGNNEQALDYLTQFVAASPEDVSGRAFLARTLLRTDNAEEAYSTLLPIADQAAEDGGLLALIGTAALFSGRHPEGVEYLERAQELLPAHIGIRTSIAVAKLASGGQDRAEGLAALKRLSEEDTGIRDLDLFRAQQHIRTGEFEQALEAARQHRQRQSEQAADSWLLEGLALVGKGDLDEAETRFRKALELDPALSDATTGIAEVQIQRGNAEAARVTLQGLLEKQPEDVGVRLNLAKLHRNIGGNDESISFLEGSVQELPASVELNVALANAYTSAFRASEALDLLSRIADQDDYHVILARGDAELTLDRPEDAITSFLRLVRKGPRVPTYQVRLSKAYRRAGEQDAALKAVEKALAINPDNLDARVERVRVILSLPNPSTKQASLAVREIKSLSEAHPTNAQIGLLRALALSKERKFAESEKLLRSVHEALQSTDSVTSLARVLWHADQRDEGLQTLADWVERFPGDNHARVHLVLLQFRSGELLGMARNALEARERGAERPGIDPYLAWALVQIGRVQEAAPYAHAAQSSAPGNLYGLHALGMVYLQEGRNRDAISTLEQIMRLTSKPSARVQIDYAEALARGGRPELARGVLERVLERTGDDSLEQKQAQAALNRLAK